MRNALFVLLLIAGIASAQQFSFHTEDTVLASAPGMSDVVAAGYVHNDGTTPISVRAYRVQNVTEAGWTTAMCMQVCMSYTIDTIAVYGLEPGTDQIFLLHFYATDTAAAQQVKIDFRNVDDTTQHSEWTFHMMTNTNTRFTWPTRSKTLAVSKVDTVRWTTDLTGKGELAISYDAGDTWGVISDTVDLAQGWFAFKLGPTKVNNAKLRLKSATYNFISEMFKTGTVSVVDRPVFPGTALAIAPNPTRGAIHMVLPEGTRHIEVRDILGRTVVAPQTSSAGPTSLDLSAFPKGMYFVVQHGQTGSSIAPVVVR
jgi:hypothetical protein